MYLPDALFRDPESLPPRGWVSINREKIDPGDRLWINAAGSARHRGMFLTVRSIHHIAEDDYSVIITTEDSYAPSYVVVTDYFTFAIPADML